MTLSSNGRQASARQKRARTGVETSTKLENIKGKSVSTDNKDTTAKDDSVNEITGPLAIPGTRPITSSDLDISHTMMVSGERPISSSDLDIVSTVNIMGIRPIGANKVEFSETMNLSGIRPIAKSHLVVSEMYSVMGNRPVASNEVDDSFSLMGFLD
ncbi:hypothetical protein [Rivularia sp. UHCC 0363]|uniref:hypothetical protein n=1 Tax=Rivularia sp. UHCC 0363 TaxID=3110244 RepID=UPI002B1F6C44|nr:hypothetical protein [Rivularia sp. UHCC 0363]MEA5594319.1 hypothetical protein [Rivularia sp. UHCC 0363]